MSPLIPELTIAMATVAGLSAVILRLAGRRDPALGHLRRLMIVAAVFYAARALNWITDLQGVRTVVAAAAALLPLMVLLLAEALMRRHAPFWLKALAAGGGRILAAAAMVPGLSTRPAYVAALLTLQIAVLAGIAVRVAMRDRARLAQSENATLDRIGLALLLLLPLLVTDYRQETWGVPIRMSGIATLTGAWIVVHLSDRARVAVRLVVELSLFVGVAALASAAAVAHLGGGWIAWTQAWAMFTAITLATATVAAAIRLSWRSPSAGLALRALARGGTLDAYLADLASAGVADRILGPADLADFDAAALASALGPEGAATLSDLPASPAGDGWGQSQLRSLFARFDADLAILAAQRPPHIALSRRQGVAGPDGETLAAFALSRLIAEKEAAACP